MGPTLAIAFGAGLASALLFATLATGNPLAVVLFYFAALPMLIAGLGWGHYAGGFAAAVGALALSLALRSQFGLFFFFWIGLPAWLLSYLALSGQPRPTAEDPQGFAWFSPGALLSVIGAGAVALTLFGVAVLFGFDFAAYQASLRAAIDLSLRRMTSVDDETRATLVTFMTTAAPVAAAIVWTFVTTLNLFIAGRIVRASGRLARPWPDLPSLRLPRWTAIALFAGCLASFAPGAIGHIGVIMVAVGLAVFALAGFALVHDLTRGWPARALALGLLYAISYIVVWPMIFVALAGLADVLFDLRDKRRAPPSPPSNP